MLDLRRSAAGLLLTAGAAAMSATVAFALVAKGPAAGMALAVLPLLALATAYFLTSGQIVLYLAAFALPMTTLPFITTNPILGSIYVQDVIIVFALGALLFATVFGRGRVPPIPWTPVVGWPLILFAVTLLTATLRGHYAYGQSLIAQPLRLVLYAPIIVGLVGMTAERMYRLLLAVFYSGAVLAALMAVYYLATGSSASGAADLSTGGMRPLGISTTLYCAGALYFGLLNLRAAPRAGARLLHLSMIAIGSFGVAVGFGRAVYTAVAVVCFLSFVTSPRLRAAVLSVLPLAAPFLVLLAIVVNQAAPELPRELVSRVTSSPEKDANVQWRVKANEAIFAEVREQPLFGVGFGRTSAFYVSETDPTTGIPWPKRVEIVQDPHNGYLFLWAGGGLVALGSLALLLVTYAVDAVRRYRSNDDPTCRLIIVWGAAMLFGFLFNAASGTAFGSPANVLAIWALLVLPAVVPRAPRTDPVTVEERGLVSRPRVARA